MNIRWQNVNNNGKILQILDDYDDDDGVGKQTNYQLSKQIRLNEGKQK